MSLDDLKTTELNLVSVDRSRVYKIGDSNGVLKIESDGGAVLVAGLQYVSSDGLSVSMASKVYEMDEFASYLKQRIITEEKNRSGADASLSSALAAEATTREQMDNSLNTAIASESVSRSMADSKLSSDLAFEVSQRVAGDSALSSSLAAASLALEDEKKRAEAVEAKLSTDLSAETSRAVSAESKLDSDLSTERTARLLSESDLKASIEAEKTRALSAEQVLSGKIDFIVANTDAKAIDSIQELLTAFQSSDSSLLATVTAINTRLTTLEAIVANLRGKA
jgi:hypothetical protein